MRFLVPFEVKNIDPANVKIDVWTNSFKFFNDQSEKAENVGAEQVEVRVCRALVIKYLGSDPAPSSHRSIQSEFQCFGRTHNLTYSDISKLFTRGACTIKLFTATITSVPFVRVCHFYPSLIFEEKSWSLPEDCATVRCFAWVGSSLLRTLMGSLSSEWGSTWIVYSLSCQY